MKRPLDHCPLVCRLFALICLGLGTDVLGSHHPLAVLCWLAAHWSFSLGPDAWATLVLEVDGFFLLGFTYWSVHHESKEMIHLVVLFMVDVAFSVPRPYQDFKDRCHWHALQRRLGRILFPNGTIFVYEGM